MIVVSNSSPLIALARIGRLNLLASLFKRILIPAEVEHEVTIAGRGLAGAEEVCETPAGSKSRRRNTRVTHR